jgi:Radical SAM proteins, N-terminal
MESVLSTERLLFVPAQPQADAVPIIFAFPNEYSVGITSLGYQVIWAMLAMRSDVQVSRLFCDWQEPLPPRPEWVGFSVSWELDYINILNLLERLQLPILSCDRSASHPLIFGGGPVLTANRLFRCDFTRRRREFVARFYRGLPIGSFSQSRCTVARLGSSPRGLCTEFI